jgi:glycosyltransferase involved in cell wall biosynthesis
MESFMQKTPVIVSNLGGMPEIVEESGAGFVYNTEDQLISAVDKLLADPSLRDELGHRGFQACQRLWTIEVYLKRYFALIDEIGRTKRSGD